MIIHFTRDSVCMGDDVEDNSRNYELSEDAVWSDIWSLVIEKNFLPHVSGSNVVWLLTNTMGNEISSYFVLKKSLVRISTGDSVKQICGSSNALHFRYYTSPAARGKELFQSYKGDTYSMWRDGVMEEYQHCEVTKELEQEWKRTM